MPIPWPTKDDKDEESFVRRCMADPEMVEMFEQEQRAGICYTQWRRYQGAESQEAAKAMLSELRTVRTVMRT